MTLNPFFFAAANEHHSLCRITVLQMHKQSLWGPRYLKTTIGYAAPNHSYTILWLSTIPFFHWWLSLQQLCLHCLGECGLLLSTSGCLTVSVSYPKWSSWHCFPCCVLPASPWCTGTLLIDALMLINQLVDDTGCSEFLHLWCTLL